MLYRIKKFFAVLFGREALFTGLDERVVPGWLLPHELERERAYLKKKTFK